MSTSSVNIKNWLLFLQKKEFGCRNLSEPFLIFFLRDRASLFQLLIKVIILAELRETFLIIWLETCRAEFFDLDDLLCKELPSRSKFFSVAFLNKFSQVYGEIAES